MSVPVGGLQEAVDQAEAEIVASVYNAALLRGRPLFAILRDLYVRAQREALESVAKEMAELAAKLHRYANEAANDGEGGKAAVQYAEELDSEAHGITRAAAIVGSAVERLRSEAGAGSASAPEEGTASEARSSS